MSNNHQIVAESLNQTLIEISRLLGNDRPENWTKDYLLGEINRLKKIEADHTKKSNQVKRLSRKLKVKAKTTLNRSAVLKKLGYQLDHLNKSNLCLMDYCYAEEEMTRREGKIAAAELLIQTIKHM